jgi:YbbR domain-containing protein
VTVPLLPEVVTTNLSLKLASLGLAVLLWVTVRADAPGRASVDDVPVNVIVDDPGWTLAAPPSPATVTVAFTGSRGDLLRVLGQPMRVVVVLNEVDDSVQQRDLDRDMVRVPGGLGGAQVVELSPSTVLLRLETMESGLRPVAGRVRGSLPPGLKLGGAIGLEPAMVRVSGARSALRQLDSVPLLPIDLSTVSAAETLRVHIDTVGVRGILVSPRYVTAIVPVVRDTTRPDTTRRDSSRHSAGSRH